jgi:hypothetical protein
MWYLSEGQGWLLKPGWLLQPLSIPEWKWDDISMDFIMGLPMMAAKFDSTWVIVDQLSKSAHFIPVNTNFKVQRYCHTPFRERGNEATIRVPRMFKSHAWQQLINRSNVINK